MNNSVLYVYIDLDVNCLQILFIYLFICPTINMLIFATTAGTTIYYYFIDYHLYENMHREIV